MKSVVVVVLGILGVLVAALAVPVIIYFPGHNWRTVEEGAFYGSRQMSARALEKAIGRHNIKTVINLRGHNTGTDWYDAEVAVCERLGVKHVSFGWSRNKLPDPASLLRFISVIEKGEKPFLAHCEGGTHRTGAAAACYQLLQGRGVAEARKQFGPMFRDAPIGEIVDLYEGSNLPFKLWASQVYPLIYEKRMLSCRVKANSGMTARQNRSQCSVSARGRLLGAGTVAG